MLTWLSKHLTTPVTMGLPFVWLAAIFIVFNFTSPLRVGPAGILLVFALFYAFISSLMFALLRIGLAVWVRVTGKADISSRRLYYLASVVAFGPVFLIALNTLSRLGIVEVILVLLLVGIGSFYVLRRDAA